MGKLVIPDSTGHAVVEWDTQTGFDFDKAEAQFAQAMAVPGSIAVVQTAPGKVEQIDTLDPTETREVRVHRQLQGG